MTEYQIITLAIFILTYLGIILFSKWKTYIISIGSLIAITYLTFIAKIPKDSINSLHFIKKTIMAVGGEGSYINWNVLGIFAGTLVITEIFIYSKVPALMADTLVSKSKNIGISILLVCILSSLISAFVENVATVLIVAPIALSIAKKQNISPVPFLIGIAISSNLQGTATLVGDPPSMILAGYQKMNFNDFFWYKGRIGIFFAVQIGAIASFIVLYLIFRKYKEKLAKIEKEKVRSWVPTLLLISMITALAISSFIDPEFSYLGGIICIFFGIIGWIWWGIVKKDRAKKLFFEFDYETMVFLTAIFIMVGSLQYTGIIQVAAQYIGIKTQGNIFLVYTIIVWTSVALSAVIDNVPYITAMIPLTAGLAKTMNIQPELLVFGLLIGSCLGGNITPVGAAANVVSVGILKKNGYPTKFWDFIKIGLPFTLAATLSSYIFVWFIWK